MRINLQQWTGAIATAPMVVSFSLGTVPKEHCDMPHTETSACQLEPILSGYALGTATASVMTLTLRGH